MKRTIASLSIAAALALAGCSSATPEAAPEATTAPVASEASVVTSEAAPLPTNSIPGYTPVAAETPEVDVTKEKVFAFEDGFVVTFNGATLATAEQVGSDPVADSDAVILSFTYQNGTLATIDLQQVPLTVWHGENLYDADQPTLYQGDSTHTELPKQVVAGSTVDVVNTY